MVHVDELFSVLEKSGVQMKFCEYECFLEKSGTWVTWYGQARSKSMLPVPPPCNKWIIPKRRHSSGVLCVCVNYTSGLFRVMLKLRIR